MSEISLKTPTAPGATIKGLRLKRGWTLTEMSERTGLPPSTLSKVENDRMSLTFDKLTRISRGLSVDIASLLNSSLAEKPPEPVVGRRSINRAGEGNEIDTATYNHLYLAGDLLNKRFTPLMAEPRARTLKEFGPLTRHAGEEYTLVLEGEVELHTELYAPVRLKVGDSIYFDSGMGHAYLNAGEGRCRLITICSKATEPANTVPVSGLELAAKSRTPRRKKLA